MDGSVNHRDKSAFLNFCGVVRTFPQTNRQVLMNDFSHHLNFRSVNNCYKSNFVINDEY